MRGRTSVALYGTVELICFTRMTEAVTATVCDSLYAVVSLHRVESGAWCRFSVSCARACYFHSSDHLICAVPLSTALRAHALLNIATHAHLETSCCHLVWR